MRKMGVIKNHETLLELDFKVIYHLVKFHGFSGMKCGNTVVFMVFDPNFAYFQPLLELLGPCQGHISEQICLIYITRVRFQAYVPFSEVSGLQWRQMWKNCNFHGF